MKIKTIGLLLSSSLILASCSSEDEDSANSAPEGAALTEQEASDEGEKTSTEHGGAEQDAATEENTPDDDADNGEDSDTGEAANPAGSSDPSTDPNADEADDAASDGGTETAGTSNVAESDGGQSGDATIALEDINLMTADALSIAEGEFEGDLHEISFEEEDGEWVYKFNMKNDSEEAEVIINQETEEVVDVRTETDDDNDNDNQKEVLDYASLNEGYDAVDEAVADAGGGELKEWKLSMEDGTPEYDIDIEYEGQTHEYKIDAETLEIIESEQDD